MKSTVIITCLLLFSFMHSFGQQSNKLKVNTQEFTLLQGCLYPEFIDGKVIYKDGSLGKAKLNYNCITREMLFISPKNDTLKLNKPEKTLMVTINIDTFCFSENTFLKKITHYPNTVNLFEKIDLRQTDREKKQAYGYSSVTADQSSTTFTNGMGTTTYLPVDQNFVYVRSKDLFISNNKGAFLPVKLASYYKICPQYRKQLSTFIKSNKTDWDELKDIIKLTEYLQQLLQGGS